MKDLSCQASHLPVWNDKIGLPSHEIKNSGHRQDLRIEPFKSRELLVKMGLRMDLWGSPDVLSSDGSRKQHKSYLILIR